ncbi:6-bladed beta-propeller [Candidatus Eisenbacteria bacterium]|uniref:6-bladed beta-propeller n=1 Tax=Eiseniibacteriota bacterium TaxID=2212470 RepID=A0ABV6YLS4_UNCEI
MRYTPINLRVRASVVALVLVAVLTPAIADVDDVPHVHNPATPPQGIEKIELRELWRAGGEDDEVFFGSIGNVLMGPDENIYIQDEQLVQIFVYSRDGEFLRTLGRAGEGPGEVRSLNAIVFLPDGTLGLGQAFPGRLVKIGLDGIPGSSFMLGSTDEPPCVLVEGQSRGNTLLLAGMRMEFLDQGNVQQHLFLTRYSPAGEAEHVYTAKQYPVNFAEFRLDEGGISFVWACFDVDEAGYVYFAPHRDAYEIHVCDLQGKLARVITRDYESLKRDDAMIEEARLTYEAVARSYNVPVQGVTVEETEQDIESLHVSPEGTLWVRTSRADRRSPKGVLTTYDQFDSAGHLQKQVQLLAPGNAAKDAIFMLNENLVVVVVGAVDAYRTEHGVSSEGASTEEEISPLEVIVYSM